MVGESTHPLVLLICAYNESVDLEKTIDLVRKTQIPCHILVVDDGSTDATKWVAESKGVEVMRLSKNMGKAYAFFSGIRKAAKYHPSVLVSLDADMHSVPKDALQSLIQSAQKSDPKKSRMTIATASEGWGAQIVDESGIRSYNLAAIRDLAQVRLSRFDKNHPSKSIKLSGYGLEVFLNFYFSHPHRETIKLTPIQQGLFFHQRPGYRLGDSSFEAFRQLQETQVKDARRQTERLSYRFQRRRQQRNPPK